MQYRLLGYYVVQILISLDYTVDYLACTDSGKMTAGAFNLGIFRTSQLRYFNIVAFCFCYEVNVLHTAFTERNSPVGIVLAHRGIDIETIG